MRHIKLILIFTLLQILIFNNAYANQLANSGFEDNPPTPPTSWGNHIDHPILPWVIDANGSRANVIKVDGNQRFGSDQGPWSDATNSPIGTVRHYLDIANGRNNFYQTFKARCSGKATFGGFFSTRANNSGQASVTLRKGDINGPIVGTSNPVNLPGGQSSTDPWTKVQYTVPVVATQTYTLEISMGNNMNFDEGFVNIPDCPGPNAPVECPPVNKGRIAGLMQWAPPPPNVQGKYQLKLNSQLPDFNLFDNQMQAYIDLHAGQSNNGADKLVTLIEYFDNPTFSGPKISQDYFCWEKGKNGANQGGCGNLDRTMNPNGFAEGQPYWIKIFTFLEGPGTGWIMDYIPRKCDKDQVLKFQWSFN